MPTAPAPPVGRSAQATEDIAMIAARVRTPGPDTARALHRPMPRTPVPVTEADLFMPVASAEAAALLRDAAANAEPWRPAPAPGPADARASYAYD